MLFSFNLLPLDQVDAWGEPGELRLHWFGLTLGEYWIRAGTDTLFEYKEPTGTSASGRYCEYQVSRLYEDVLEIIPAILEPVPTDLIRYISGDSARQFENRICEWEESSEESAEGSDRWDRVYEASLWIAERSLDSGYLTVSSGIRIWSDESVVNIEWDNRDRLRDGRDVWSAKHGSYALSRDNLLQEFISFHERLMMQMGERVDEVLSGAITSVVDIDLDLLQKQQSDRSNLSDSKIGPRVGSTDWNVVQKAIARLERAMGE